MPFSSAKHEQSETLVGLNTVKTECVSGVNGQPFSPMTLLRLESGRVLSGLATSRSPASWRHIPRRRDKSMPTFSPLQWGHMATRIIGHTRTIRSACKTPPLMMYFSAPGITTGSPIQSPFVPPTSVVFINSVWFLCLVLSLTCALMATLL
ncbi:hypothetical protein EDB85DRAFT_1029945 [Lactarius pseudohatsudake]|nr:hypothetical protein EDB85DRAFT_1029945 [Lactarius pseudohatsudake]